MPANKVFVDTNIWLYSLVKTHEEDARHEAAVVFLEGIERPVISTQVINEATHNLIKKAKIAEPELRLLIGDWYQDCEVKAGDESQCLLASALREAYALSYWDSLIIASALSVGCTTLYTEDMQHGQVINNTLTICNPFKS